MTLAAVLVGGLVVVGVLYWMVQPPRHTRPGKVPAAKVDLAAFRSGHPYVYSVPGLPGHPYTVTCKASDGTTYSSDHPDDMQ